MSSRRAPTQLTSPFASPHRSRSPTCSSAKRCRHDRLTLLHSLYLRTHAALRGAADFDDDRQVTLTEAYRYAHATTQARSREAAQTTQNPSWDLALSGSGDLVLTRLDLAGLASLAGASLATPTLDPTLSGRLTFYDDRGRLALELDKATGERPTMTIPAGTWRLQMTRARRRYEATFAITPGSTHISTFKHLEFRETLDETRLRGGPPTTRLRRSIVPTLGFDSPGSTAIVHGASIALLGDAVAELRGLQLAPLFSSPRSSTSPPTSPAPSSASSTSPPTSQAPSSASSTSPPTSPAPSSASSARPSILRQQWRLIDQSKAID